MMMPSHLIDSFEIIWSATNGVNHARKLIYNLAVSGELSKAQFSSENWQSLPISECANIFNGNSTSSSEKSKLEQNTSGLNYIATKDVGYGFEPIEYNTGLKIGPEQGPYKIAPKNAVLICLEGGSAGKKMGITERDISFGNKLFACVSNEMMLPKFLLISFLSDQFQSSFRSRMSGIIGGISKAKFSDIYISVPPLAEQEVIIQTVEKLLNTCNQLESSQMSFKNISSLLRESAVNAIATAETDESLRFAWKRIQTNWDSIVGSTESITSLRQLILGLAFRGYLSSRSEKVEWVQTTLGELCDVRDGTHDSPKRAASGFPLVTSKNLKNGSVDTSNTYLISEKDYLDICKRSKVDKFDILISMIGTVGEVAIEVNTPNYAIKNVGLIKSGDETLSRFLAHYLASPIARNYFDSASSGGIQKFLSLGKLRMMPVQVPDRSEQSEIVAKLDDLLGICDHLESLMIKAAVDAEKFAQGVLASNLSNA